MILTDPMQKADKFLWYNMNIKEPSNLKLPESKTKRKDNNSQETSIASQLKNKAYVCSSFKFQLYQVGFLPSLVIPANSSGTL